MLLVSLSTPAWTAKWDTIRNDEMGFSIQLPAGSTKSYTPPPEQGTLSLYVSSKMAIAIGVYPTPHTQLASTVIEQSIQSAIKRFAEFGASRRWEQPSKQGDLFKGFVGPIRLDAGNALDQEIVKIIGTSTGFQCSSMASLGDETAPILEIRVIGPVNKEKDVIATAKAVAASVKRDNAPPNTNIPIGAKPPAALKIGEIELEGIVESLADNHKCIVIKADFIRLYNQSRIALSPARSKQVFFKTKQDWVKLGQRVIVVAKNTGVGKPVTANIIKAATIK